ncbi:MAG TPA: CBS domain-containing protein [Methylomirabilota bacterium]|nr:CBS domain-containing protein [Methylomirabilota bacterium]
MTIPSFAEVAAAFFHWLEYAGLLGFIGIVVVRRLAAMPPLISWARIPMHRALAAALAGGLGLVLVQVLTGQVSLFVIIRVVAEGIALGLCLNGRLWVVVPGIFAAASLAFASHAAAVHPPAGAIFTDAIHVLSAGMWAGGILVLATLRPPGGWRGEEGRALLARFGRVAFLAFAITALTGVLRASEAVGRLSDLWATPYGLVLSAKAVGVLVMVGMSAVVWRRGFRLARLEGVLVLLIIAATGALAAFPMPPRPGIEFVVMATVKEVMNETLFTVNPSTTVGEAVALMAQHQVGSMLVMDGTRLEGIFTERDTVRAISQAHDAPAHSVSSWMTADPVTVGPEEPVEDALKTMLDRGFRHLPVVKDGEVIGIVSIRDLAG